jgi:hypothetical protein
MEDLKKVRPDGTKTSEIVNALFNCKRGLLKDLDCIMKSSLKLLLDNGIQVDHRLSSVARDNYKYLIKEFKARYLFGMCPFEMLVEFHDLMAEAANAFNEIDKINQQIKAYEKDIFGTLDTLFK